LPCGHPGDSSPEAARLLVGESIEDSNNPHH
jgi:hypothetical protein